MLKINNVSKSYGNLDALKSVEFEVPKQSIFGLLGPNGSGKSTLIKILGGLIRSWEGDILFLDESIKGKTSYLNNFGFIIEEPSFYEYLSAKNNLEIFSKISNTKSGRIDYVLDLVGLSGRENDKVANYSYGMKQRLGIAQSLLHDPSILIYDEPNNGLDPLGINQMADIIHTLNQAGKTVCLSTHSLSEVERLCTDVAILKKGKLLTSQKTKIISKESKLFRLESADSSETIKSLSTVEDLKVVSSELKTIIVECTNPKNELLFIEALSQLESVLSLNEESALIKYFYD